MACVLFSRKVIEKNSNQRQKRYFCIQFRRVCFQKQRQQCQTHMAEILENFLPTNKPTALRQLHAQIHQNWLTKEPPAISTFWLRLIKLFHSFRVTIQCFSARNNNSNVEKIRHYLQRPIITLKLVFVFVGFLANAYQKCFVVARADKSIHSFVPHSQVSLDCGWALRPILSFETSIPKTKIYSSFPW